MQIKRLHWAGVLLSGETTNCMIDGLGSFGTVNSLMGAPAQHSPLDDFQVDVALVTHVHPDHYDAAFISTRLNKDGNVLCPKPIVSKLQADGFDARGLDEYETVDVGEWRFSAAPSVDGFGDAQVAWVVETAGTRIIHCGDTLWHGNWWRIAREFGSFNAAFLPINAAVVEFPILPKHSGVPAVMTPRQAAAAAYLLGAEVAIPIHYGLFNNPPLYVEYDNALETFLKEMAEMALAARVLDPNETLELLCSQA